MAIASSARDVLGAPKAGRATEPSVPAGVWVIAAVVVLGAFMTQLDTALVNIGLATIAADLHATLQDTQWIVSGYLLGLVIGLPAARWCASRFGVGRLWCWSLVTFTITSGLCAGARNVPELIAARVLQGVAGGLLLPAGQTVIAQVAGRRFIGRVMSTAGAPLVLGPALGPVVGGTLIAHASWPWLFLVNIPFGIAGVWLGYKVIPRGRPAPASFDVVGFLLIGLALPALTFAISRPGRGESFVGFVLPVVVGVAGLAAFGRRSLTTEHPLFDVRLFANTTFSAAAVTSFLAGAMQIGALVLFALEFQLARGYGPIVAGIAMAGFALGAAVLPVAGKFTDRYGGGRVVFVGATLSLIALAFIAILPMRVPLLLLEALTFVFGVGNALSVVPSSTAAYVAVAPSKMADAVTQINIVLRLGGAISAAAVVSVLGAGAGTGVGARSTLAAGFQHAYLCVAACAVISVAAAFALMRAGRPERPPGWRAPSKIDLDIPVLTPQEKESR